MQHFETSTLKTEPEAVLRAADAAPVLLTREGQPRYAVMEVSLYEEFLALRQQALLSSAESILRENAPAFAELAK